MGVQSQELIDTPGFLLFARGCLGALCLLGLLGLLGFLSLRRRFLLGLSDLLGPLRLLGFLCGKNGILSPLPSLLQRPFHALEQLLRNDGQRDQCIDAGFLDLGDQRRAWGLAGDHDDGFGKEPVLRVFSQGPDKFGTADGLEAIFSDDQPRVPGLKQLIRLIRLGAGFKFGGAPTPQRRQKQAAGVDIIVNHKDRHCRQVQQGRPTILPNDVLSISQSSKYLIRRPGLLVPVFLLALQPISFAE